tara:strand:+ start:5734 stop:5913 length:180 start_codon:yes stop_codon:yes gene_type:complete
LLLQQPFDSDLPEQAFLQLLSSFAHASLSHFLPIQTEEQLVRVIARTENKTILKNFIIL